jgi:DNA polymerase alpha subunit A
LKKEINEKYKCLEIDIDGIFKPLLLVKKKKYAALKLENLQDFLGPSKDISIEPKFKQEVKGLDMVRRDWCILSKNSSERILKNILSDQGSDEMIEAIKIELTKIGKRVRGEEGSCTLREYTITKQLTKDPAKYPNDKG